jgi:hypothetical protein
MKYKRICLSTNYNSIQSCMPAIYTFIHLTTEFRYFLIVLIYLQIVRTHWNYQQTEIFSLNDETVASNPLNIKKMQWLLNRMSKYSAPHFQTFPCYWSERSACASEIMQRALFQFCLMIQKCSIILNTNRMEFSRKKVLIKTHA